MTALVIPLFPSKPSARLYHFPRDRVVRFTAAPEVLTQEDRLTQLAKMIAEEIENAPPRIKPKKSAKGERKEAKS